MEPVEGETEEKEQVGPSIAAVDASHKALMEKIRFKKQERSELKEITQKQLKNISDLQKKCEESFIMINHLPQTRQAASEKFNEAMKDTTILQNKQFKVNELLNLSMSEFDETITLVNAAKQQLDLQKELANQRLLIYDADPKELSKLGKKNITLLEESFKSKYSLLQELKMFLKQGRIEELRIEHEAIKKKTNDLEVFNNNLEKELLLIENNLKTCIENSDILDRTMEQEISSLTDDEKFWKLKSEELKNCLNEVINKNLNIMKITEEEKANYAIMKGKLDQEVDKMEVIEKNILNKLNEMDIVKEELNCCLFKTNQLKETILMLNKLRSLCSAKEIQIQELNEKKEKVLHQLILLNTELSTSNEEISATENKFSSININIDTLKSTLNTVNAKIKELMEAYEQQKELSESSITSLCNEIDNSKHVNNLLEEEIEKKKTFLNDRKNYLAIKMEEYEKKKIELIERKDEIHNRKKIVAEDQTKTKFNELTEEIHNKNQEISRLKERKEAIAALVEKIQIQKNNYSELVESYEKQKEELKELCNNKLENKLSEMQAFKHEKQKALEKIRDETGKAEFTYHRLKRQVQQLKGEVNSAKDTCKMYQCENDMLKMLVGWLNNSTSRPSNALQTEDESEDNFSLPGDGRKELQGAKKGDSNSSVDDLEEMPAPEMSTQQYCRTKTLDKSIQRTKKKNPSPKRSKKKTKKEPKNDFIFDWVMDSSSQLSSE